MKHEDIGISPGLHDAGDPGEEVQEEYMRQ
jgi:hypothetical protein